MSVHTVHPTLLRTCGPPSDCPAFAAVGHRQDTHPTPLWPHRSVHFSRQQVSKMSQQHKRIISGAHAQETTDRATAPKTLNAVVAEECKGHQQLCTEDMMLLFDALATATKMIADLVSRVALDDLTGLVDGAMSSTAGRDEPKKLDIVADNVMQGMLQGCGKVAVLASEEVETPLIVQDKGYVVVFDPLDGSRNIEVSIPTGTIFGVYARKSLLHTDLSPQDRAAADCLQPGKQLLAAGYALYSSATVLVISLGSGTHGFTLDRSLGEYVLSHPSISIPQQGQIYSVNDARYWDWPEGLRHYIDDIRRGRGRNPKQYSARYVCSLVADFHRTLLYGGLAMNPRSHLRLLYEGNPLAFLVEQAGGKASDGKRRILEIQPEKVHQRLPLFLGSPLDIDELESYGDVQQLVNPGYTV